MLHRLGALMWWAPKQKLKVAFCSLPTVYARHVTFNKLWGKPSKGKRLTRKLSLLKTTPVSGSLLPDFRGFLSFFLASFLFFSHPLLPSYPFINAHQRVKNSHKVPGPSPFLFVPLSPFPFHLPNQFGPVIHAARYLFKKMQQSSPSFFVVRPSVS